MMAVILTDHQVRNPGFPREKLPKKYDGSELAVNCGESVILSFEDGDWAYVEKRGGNSGWIPSKILGDLELDDLPAFILEGKLRGWVGGLEGGQKIAASRVGSKDIVFDRGPFHYHDSFVGFSDFLGQEHIAFRGNPVWSMSYYGYLFQPDRFSGRDAVRVLEKALPRMYLDEKRFLGGFVYQIGDIEYRDANQGDWRRFHGDEKISLRGELVYELKYFGGCIRE